MGCDDGIYNKYKDIRKNISELAKIPEHLMSKGSMLHLTLLMLDFTDPARLTKARAVLNELGE